MQWSLWCLLPSLWCTKWWHFSTQKGTLCRMLSSNPQKARTKRLESLGYILKNRWEVPLWKSLCGGAFVLSKKARSKLPVNAYLHLSFVVGRASAASQAVPGTVPQGRVGIFQEKAEFFGAGSHNLVFSCTLSQHVAAILSSEGETAKVREVPRYVDKDAKWFPGVGGGQLFG